MTAWQDGFRQVAGQVAPRAGHFLRWWRGSLLAWLPLRWQWALGWAPARLLLQVKGDVLLLTREVGSQRIEAGRLPWPCEATALSQVLEPRVHRLPRFWLIAADQVLRRTLRLPSTAAERLHDVMAYEIDRQTPFTAEQVSFDVRPLGLVSPEQLEAELVVLPRVRLEQWQQSVGSWADAVGGIDVLGEDGSPLQVNLMPMAQRQRTGNPQLRVELLLACAAVVMLLLAGSQLLDNREQAADALRGDVERSARNARGVADERAQLQALVDGAAFLDQQRAQRPAMLSLWNELSRLLPDGTYLEKMGVEGNQLQLIGLSREANQLVPLLQGSALWQRVNLTGVLQADGSAGGRDRFTLTAELRPVAAVATVPAKEAADADATHRP
ncbi:PilN domain-containing protein [Stenotrophomonas tumulicola]|uniref:PilN domain-containing protein n=1 Tax=Stenotrophomonas tumulicola TaxID=1685415 RepID=A0A7W3FP50_9GAMM|nr:PilN domain-containing protein [Stenotrophomonas tumulicola]MBA8682797.1 PilN domain-containing protein [Stenotrophomonas tumulicola]